MQQFYQMFFCLSCIYFPQNICICANIFWRIISDNHLLIKFLCNRKPFLPSFRKKTIYKICEFSSSSNAFFKDLLFQLLELDVFQIQYTLKTLVIKLFTMNSGSCTPPPPPPPQSLFTIYFFWFWSLEFVINCKCYLFYIHSVTCFIFFYIWPCSLLEYVYNVFALNTIGSFNVKLNKFSVSISKARTKASVVFLFNLNASILYILYILRLLHKNFLFFMYLFFFLF